MSRRRSIIGPHEGVGLSPKVRQKTDKRRSADGPHEGVGMSGARYRNDNIMAAEITLDQLRHQRDLGQGRVLWPGARRQNHHAASDLEFDQTRAPPANGELGHRRRPHHLLRFPPGERLQDWRLRGAAATLPPCPAKCFTTRPASSCSTASTVSSSSPTHQPQALDDNRESLLNLGDNLQELGMSLGRVPYVIQFNKRDLRACSRSTSSITELNQEQVPHYATTAINGEGQSAENVTNFRA